MSNEKLRQLVGKQNALNVELDRINTILDTHAKNKERGIAAGDSSPLIQKTLDELDDVIKRFKKLADEYDLS